jgi:Flp pilus assembly pilin Flp
MIALIVALIALAIVIFLRRVLDDELDNDDEFFNNLNK